MVDTPPDMLHRHIPSQAAIRETIESVAIAFILAFLFRTFEAEAFVIPTGSMAPTLMGRHKDLECPKCGYPYQVSASDEVTQDGALRGQSEQIASGTCPMCRYTADLGPNNPQHKKYPSYNGDRILVGKFPYEFREPQRWDVIVFKYPGDAPTNFIKRLIGLPGETIRIQHGDIWTSRGGEPFQIARKSPDKLLAMLQPVFDNDYMPKMAEYGWPAPWRPETAGDASNAGAWRSDDYAAFSVDGSAAGEQWLRYYHLVPSDSQWQEVDPKQPRAMSLQPQLIADFTAYNTSRTLEATNRNPAPDPDMLGTCWVGDLALNCTADVQSDAGELVLELRKGGRRFQCRIDVASGRAALSISGPSVEQFRPTALTNLRGKGRHDIIFSNCDNELLLWIDGSVVSFDAPTTYDDLGNYRPDAADLAPVGVASAGAQVRLSHLAISRDLYYIADLRYGEHLRFAAPDARFVADAFAEEVRLRNATEGHADFPLKADQFFVLGDNSARSKDGRLWGPEYWVSRELLIGKALFIYWPHSWDKIRTPWVDVPFPYFPNFGRMRLVR